LVSHKVYELEVNQMENGLIVRGAILIGLAAFGIGYDQFVGWMETKGYDRGYTALLVVVGTLVTLLPLIPLSGLSAYLDAMILFAASGSPMIVGSWKRHVRARERDEEAARNAAREALK
jgi:hypothetical protein